MFGFALVGPLSESFAPPSVVFRGGIELRQIKGDNPYFLIIVRFHVEVIL